MGVDSLDALLFLSSFQEFWPIDSRSVSCIQLGGKYLVEHLIEFLDKMDVGKIIIAGGSDELKLLESKLSENIKSDILYINIPRDFSVEEAILHVCPEIHSDRFFLLHGHDLLIENFFSNILHFKDSFIIDKESGIIRYLNAETRSVSKFGDKDSFFAYILEKLKAIEIEALFPKYSWHILHIMRYFLKNKITTTKVHPNTRISKWAIIEGPIVIDEGARIFRNAIINGPAYIGKNVIIGDHTLIRESIVEERSLIGCGMEVARSFVHKNVETHSGFLGDSILDSFSHLGAGFISANLRLDRNYVKVILGDKRINTKMKKLGAIIGEKTEVGVHVAVMPGKLIGKNVVIGPGTIVTKNVEDETLLFVQYQYVEKKLSE